MSVQRRDLRVRGDERRPLPIDIEHRTVMTAIVDGPAEMETLLDLRA
jgi:hypothetical protein